MAWESGMTVSGTSCGGAAVQPFVWRSDGEHYWFLDLVTKLAEFANRALPLHVRRPDAAALTGIVAEELEQLRK